MVRQWQRLYDRHHHDRRQNEDGTDTLWAATLTVEQIIGGTSIFGYAYHESKGTLSSDTYTIGGADYPVLRVTVNRIFTPPRLQFWQGTSFPAEKSNWILYMDETAFRASAAYQLGANLAVLYDPNDYWIIEWTNPNLNWADEDEVAVKLVRLNKPSAPTNLAALAVGSTQIDLSWSAPSKTGGEDITGYKIEVSSDGGDNWSNLVTDTSSTGTTYSHTGVSMGGTRHYRVSAINDIGTSPVSNTASMSVVSSRILVSNLRRTTVPSVRPFFHAQLGTNDLSQAFTTGENAYGYELTGVRVKFGTIGRVVQIPGSTLTSSATPSSSASATFTAYIADGLDSEATVVANLTNPETWSATSRLTAPTGITLDASTTYYLIVEGSSGGLETTSQNSEDSSGAAGWSIANGRESRGAANSGLGGTWSNSTNALKIAVEGTELPNRAPAFSDGMLSRSVAENTATGTAVGDPIPAATDADGHTLTYTMEGDDADSFDFDAATRQIETKAGVTYDHEADRSYSVTIEADDGNGGTDTVAVSIGVTDVKEPPAAPAAPSVAAGMSDSSTSLDVSWSAPENAGKPAVENYDLRYRAGISGNWIDGPQNVAETSSAITGLTSNTAYQVQVRATNEEGDSPWSDTGSGSTHTVTDFLVSNVGQTETDQMDANSLDLAQAFKTGANAFGYTLSSIEVRLVNGSETVAVTNVPTVRVVQGNAETGAEIATLDGGSQSIDASATVVRAYTAPANTGLAASTTYHVVIEGGADLEVSLTDSDSEDADGATTDWSIADQAFVRSASSTGNFGLALSSSFMIRVNGTVNASNVAPAFSGGALSRSVAENSAADANVGAVIHAATDANGDTLTYTMVGADATSFAFDASTRQIKTKTGVTYDHEADPSYEVTIKAEDSHGGAATVAVTIGVTDVKEPPAAPAAPSVAGTSGSSTSLDIAWAAPGNAGRPAIESYDLRYRTGDGNWTDGPQNVTDTASMIESLTAGTAYEVQVRATNEEGDGDWSPSGSGSTNAAPVFTPNTATRSVAENSVADTNVGAVIHAATDADNDPLTYTMEGADADSFAFDATTRQIKTKAGVSYDHEAEVTYSVTIEAADGHGGAATVAVTIGVTDVNEPPAAPAAPSVAATPGLTTSLDVSWAAPGNAGKPAISSYDLRYRTGAGNWANGSQGVTATPSTIASLTVGTAYEVQVRATNDEGNGPWSDSGTGSTGFEPTVVPRGWDLIPPGLDPGDNFRLLIVTSTPQVPSSTVIGAYDTVVRNDVSGNGHTAIRGYSSHFKMLGCTSTIDATVHTGTRSGDTSAYIYWLNGAKVADDYGDFYDGNWDSNAPKYPSGEDAPTTGSNSRVFHGCLSTGLRSTHSLGPTQASDQVTTGLPGVRGFELHDLPQLVGTNGRPYYGLSRIFQVPPNNAPVFTGGPLSRSIPENTTTVTDIGAAIHAATDADNDPLTYTMEGADADSFTFDATTRQIKTKAGVSYDHEAEVTYSVTIEAADGYGGAATVAVTIGVTDVNEPPAAPEAPSVAVTSGSGTSLDIAWAAPGNAGRPAIESYDLRYRTGDGNNWTDGPQNVTDTPRRSRAWRRARPTRCRCARPMTRATALGRTPAPAPPASSQRWFQRAGT